MIWPSVIHFFKVKRWNEILPSWKFIKFCLHKKLHFDDVTPQYFFSDILNYTILAISLKDHYRVVVRGLVYLSDPGNYAGGSLHPDRVTHVGQVER